MPTKKKVSKKSKPVVSVASKSKTSKTVSKKMPSKSTVLASSMETSKTTMSNNMSGACMNQCLDKSPRLTCTGILLYGIVTVIAIATKSNKEVINKLLSVKAAYFLLGLAVVDTLTVLCKKSCNKNK